MNCLLSNRKLIDEYNHCFSNDEIHQSKEYTGISEALKFYITKRKIFVVSNKEILTTQKYLDYLGLSRFITDSLGVCIKMKTNFFVKRFKI